MAPSLHSQCLGSVPSWAPKLPGCPYWLAALLPGDLHYPLALPVHRCATTTLARSCGALDPGTDLAAKDQEEM